MTVEFPPIVWVNLAAIPGYRVPPLIADKVKT